MKVLAIGASRNIGYYAAIRLLDEGASITFLLRSPSVFDNDEKIKTYVTSGRARLVKGDALNKEDLLRAWQIAGQSENEGVVGLLLFTVGGKPSFSITKGAIITPADLCTQSLLNALTTIPASNKPKIIVITSNGLDKASHKALPLPMRLLYEYLLGGPHEDKLGAERVLAHCTGKAWIDPEPKAHILPAGWLTTPGLPSGGELKEDVVVVRPAMLTDGSCRAEAGKTYRTSDTIILGAYTVSRRDVAHFIVEGIIKNWDTWKGKIASIVY
ncbi:hypothetical protein GLOTRDRAFT_36959 [Gloeophyllum trabeum ATCC 11539]|uniref:NAD P-binding protein n=1 Tax=Gloeophyllum trabeum (strain ATCC 11539 / FP-39264 / Madison 617) TaxID=670483 RepID=S7RWV5_GLOTA|nr:uncharacterized protein GLOTRDRAFT_36959 [Gloeophyllum trabeum ATCC 11539]EPQ57839.1 hypothetical protein GLOTRDRAFT_36959 [Gloeophyllum trabeum ATCC 11539]